MFSTTYFAAAVTILSQVLPLLGINVGSDALTTTIQTIVAIVAGLWVIKERIARGDVKWFGARK